MHNILGKEINLLLPQISRVQKCGIITMLVSSFIGLAYEGISSFLHNGRNKALHNVNSGGSFHCPQVHWGNTSHLHRHTDNSDWSHF